MIGSPLKPGPVSSSSDGGRGGEEQIILLRLQYGRQVETRANMFLL